MPDRTVKCPDCGALISEIAAGNLVRYGFTLTNPVPAEVRDVCLHKDDADPTNFECLSLKYAAEAAMASIARPSILGGPARRPQNAGAGPIFGTGWPAALRLFALGALGLLLLMSRLVRDGTITLPWR